MKKKTLLFLIFAGFLLAGGLNVNSASADPGACGSYAGSYTVGESTWHVVAGAANKYCNGGFPDTSPGFPNEGQTVNWKCCTYNTTNCTPCSAKKAGPTCIDSADGKHITFTDAYNVNGHDAYDHCISATTWTEYTCANGKWGEKNNTCTGTQTCPMPNGNACVAAVTTPIPTPTPTTAPTPTKTPTPTPTPTPVSSTWNGKCGTANGATLAYNATGWGTLTLCEQGNAEAISGTSIWPPVGGSVSWKCKGGGSTVGNDSPTCTVSRSANSAKPEMTFTATSSKINLYQSVTLHWSVKNADSCIATSDSDGSGGRWSGSQLTGGSYVFAVTPTTIGTKNYTLSCTNTGGGSNSISLNVEVVLGSDSGGNPIAIILSPENKSKATVGVPVLFVGGGAGEGGTYTWCNGMSCGCGSPIIGTSSTFSRTFTEGDKNWNSTGLEVTTAAGKKSTNNPYVMLDMGGGNPPPAIDHTCHGAIPDGATKCPGEWGNGQASIDLLNIVYWTSVGNDVNACSANPNNRYKGCEYYIPSTPPTVGFLDDATCTNNKIKVKGWAFDPDFPKNSIDIHVYDGYQANVSAGTLLGSCKADQSSADVNTNAEFTKYGLSGNHRFECELPDIVTNGSHPISIFGIDNSGDSTKNIVLGTRNVTCTSSASSCKGTRSLNSTIWGSDGNDASASWACSTTDTSNKCEYKCNQGFQCFANNLVSGCQPLAIPAPTATCDATGKLSISWQGVAGEGIWYALRIDDTIDTWAGDVPTANDQVINNLTTTSYSYQGKIGRTYKIWANPVVENGTNDIWGDRTRNLVTMVTCSGGDIITPTPTPIIITTPDPSSDYCGYAGKKYPNRPKTYSAETTSFGNDKQCQYGDPIPAYVSFPGRGQTVSWICKNQAGTAQMQCYAKRNDVVLITPTPTPITSCVSEGGMCSGISGKMCCEKNVNGANMECKMDNNNPDATGICQVSSNNCQNKCGDGICQDNLDVKNCSVTDGCPCSETAQICPSDCTNPTPTPIIHDYQCTGTLPSNAVECPGDAKGALDNLVWKKVGVSSNSCTPNRKCEYYTPNPEKGAQCGTANKFYEAESTNFGNDTFCAKGIATPTNPLFPDFGKMTEWQCSETGNTFWDTVLFKKVVSCAAGRKSETINPGCGTASGNYPATATTFKSEIFCADGYGLTSEKPTFPITPGTSIDWVCRPNLLNRIFTNKTAVVCTVKRGEGTVPTYSCTGDIPTDAVKCSNDEVGLTSNLAWTNVGIIADNCTSTRKCEYYIPSVATPTPTPGTTTPTPTPIITPTPTTPIQTPMIGNGDGLMGKYFDFINFTGQKDAKVDPTINFNWGYGSPINNVIDPDTFSIRWTGKVQPKYTGEWTFYVTADDGVRLWVDNKLLVDKWIDQVGTEYSSKITLVAGQKYDIKMEYYENGGDTVAKLAWSHENQGEEIIPQSQLYSK